MPTLGWIFIAAVVIAALFAIWSTRSSLAKQLSDQGQRLEAARERADHAAAEAARLPDALERERQARAQADELGARLRQAESSTADIAARLEGEVSRRNETDEKFLSLETEHEQRGRELHDARLRANTSSATLESTQREIGELRDRFEQMEKFRDQALEDLRKRGEELATTIAARDAAIELANQSRAFVETAREAMRTTFVEAASSVFDEKSAVLDRRIKETGDRSKEQLVETLKPFADNVAHFRQRMEQLNESQSRDSATLQGSIGKLQELNQHMADAAGALTKALKGNAKIRGDWGEMILETVLKSSGLEEGITYRRQSSNKDEETGLRRQPDVIFDLPDGRQVVIDSKVNLIAWADANAAETAEAQQDALIRHTAALRAHMKDLADKNYPKVLGGQTLELTILFVPIEGALAAALTFDRNLQTEAFSKRIAFASPNTLMAILKVVERLWIRDKLQKQVDVIGSEAGKLLDSLTSFLDDFAVIEDRLTSVTKAYSGAKNRLFESNQSVVARAQRLVTAGARGKKILPDALQADPGEQTLLLPQEE